MSAPSTTERRRYVRIVRHFVASRGIEVGILQAAPLLGASVGGLGVHDAGRATLLVLGSVALTAHVFLINDWADFRSDTRDLRRADLGTNRYGTDRTHIAQAAFATAVIGLGALAALGLRTVIIGAGVAALSLLYSCAPRLGKSAPGAASLNHVVGGGMHFLLGYSVGHAIDAKGIAVGAAVGLVFAAGHLNQEVRDYEFDRASGIQTFAVRFGQEQGFFASFCLFTAAYLLIAALAAVGTLPTLLLASLAVWLVQARWWLQALHRGVGAEAALWMQRRYRLLFIAVGFAMLIR